MRYLLFILLLIPSIVHAKTLVTYSKSTGDIIQTNAVDKMPEDNIIDRLISSDRAVILVDEDIGIDTQRIKNGKVVSKTDKELKLIAEEREKELKIKAKMRELAEKALEDEDNNISKNK